MTTANLGKLCRPALATLGVLLVICFAGCAPAPYVVAPSIEVPFPSPMSGPGQPEIDSASQQQLREAWKLLLAGATTKAEQLTLAWHDQPQGFLLQQQLHLLDAAQPAQAAELIEPLREQAALYPSYAALWATLSVAAEQAGDEATALAAADRTADLWSHQPWSSRVTTLHQRWVEQRVSTASSLLAEGETDGSLELLDAALALEPEHRQARLVKAEVLIARDQVADAEILLATLPGDPDALLLAGRIAEGRGDWLTAMDLYNALPEGLEGRAQSLHRVQLQWRLSHLPEHVQEALSSPQLTRAELAVLVVALAPQVEGLAGRSVQVLSDIVDLPGYREILVATGLQLIEVDPLEHRFYPNRPCTPAELRFAIDGLCHLLGAKPVAWCEPDIVVPSCIELASVITGARTAELLIHIVQGEGR